LASSGKIRYCPRLEKILVTPMVLGVAQFNVQPTVWSITNKKRKAEENRSVYLKCGSEYHKPRSGNVENHITREVTMGLN